MDTGATTSAGARLVSSEERVLRAAMATRRLLADARESLTKVEASRAKRGAL